MQIKEPLKYLFNRSVLILPFYTIPILHHLITKSDWYFIKKSSSFRLESSSLASPLFPTLPHPSTGIFFLSNTFPKELCTHVG